jgi:hypothetical protein
MKKFILLIIVCNSLFMNAQTWTFNSGGSDFDGKYKTSSIKGSATNYPYNTPLLVINYFEKDDLLNFYINNSGYYSDSSDVEVLWVFNNEKDVIYETPALSLSSDGKSIFFKKFKSPKSGNLLSVYEFIEKLKKASSISVRVKGQFDKNDIKFSLRGSSKAINYIIPAEKMKSKINVIKLARSILKKESIRNDSIKIIQKNIRSKLRKISDIENFTLKKIDREDMIGEKIKFLQKSGRKEYDGFGKTKSAYPYLKYDEFKGRIAKIIDLKKGGYSIVSYTYTLELEDNKEIVYMVVEDYSEIRNSIGFISLLNKAKERYLGKTFYSSQFPELQEFEDLQDCRITKITFAEDDGNYAQLYGAFNVYFETKGHFNDYLDKYFEEEKSKMINIKFTNTYAPVDGYEYKSDKQRVFENIFYSSEEFAEPIIEEEKELLVNNEIEELSEDKEIELLYETITGKSIDEFEEAEKIYIISTSNGKIIKSKGYRVNNKKRITDIQRVDGTFVRLRTSKIISIKQNGKELLIN